MTSPDDLLRGFSQLIDLFKKNPENKLIMTRYLQLVTDLNDLQVMAKHLEPLLDVSIGLPRDTLQDVATRLWAIDPTHTLALQTLVQVFEQSGEMKKSLIFQNKLERHTDDFSSPFALAKLPDSEVAADPLKVEAAQPEMAEAEASPESQLAGLSQSEFKVEQPDANESLQSDAYFLGTEKDAESKQSEIGSFDLFAKDDSIDENRIAPESLPVSEIRDSSDHMESPEVPMLELSSLGFPEDSPEEATKMLDSPQFEEAATFATPNFEVRVVAAIDLLPAATPSLEKPLPSSLEAQDSKNYLEEGESEHSMSLAGVLGDLDIRQLSLGQDIERISSLKGIEPVIEPLIEQWALGNQSSLLMLRDISIHLSGVSITTLLERALYRRFDEKLFIDVVSRLLKEGRSRKICATIGRFAISNPDSLNLKYKRVFIRAQASLGYLPPSLRNDCSLLEIVKRQPRFSRVALSASA